MIIQTWYREIISNQ